MRHRSHLNQESGQGPVVPWHSVLWYSLAMTTYQQKITFSKMRELGVRDVLIYCRDHRCSHNVEINADGWPDQVRLSDLELKFTLESCGVPKRGPPFNLARTSAGYAPFRTESAYVPAKIKNAATAVKNDELSPL